MSIWSGKATNPHMENEVGALVEPTLKSKPRGNSPAQKRLQQFAKRALDVAGAAVLLVLLSPLFLVVSVAIKLDDGGPIFYRRRVAGQEGEFDAFKFRTMVPNARAILESNAALREVYKRNFKLKDDPRITRVGAWLRRYSLDELPQLVNVARGQMSLVGPRMSTTEELDRYGSNREVVLRVKPGITGYWQVNGRQDVSFEEHIAMDIYYVENWSLWLDFKILLKTPLAVVSGEGAY